MDLGLKSKSDMPPIYTTTYGKVLNLANEGDPEFQNLLGFMLLYGEVATRNTEEAHRWFHKAAQSGYSLAQRNDSDMHKLLDVRSKGGLAGERASDIEELRRQQAFFSEFSKREISATPASAEMYSAGEKLYTTFCAGCHGLNGIAAYVESPSFTMNERLEKSNETLLKSVRNGMGDMPGWAGALSDQDLLDIIIFIRTLKPDYESGIGQALRRAPQRYFLFGTMRYDHTAYQND